MFLALCITVLYIIFCWLVFFKFRVIRFNFAWGIVSFWVGFHLILIFVIALRFFQPFSADAHLVRHTIQLVPRLPQPTLLTEVLVEPNTHVEKGQPLFKFDARIYRDKVEEMTAKLAAAQQNVLILEVDVQAAQASVKQAMARQRYADEQQRRYADLVSKGGARAEQLSYWTDELDSRTAEVQKAEAHLRKAELALDSQVDGVNTTVVEAEAKLNQAKYYLEQTTIYAPEDGTVTNLQARPGLVVGDRRIGAIASWIAADGPYMLATFMQQRLKFVELGQPVEVALDMYPGQIFKGTVKEIWWASGQGQMKPSGDIPKFRFPHVPGRFAVQVTLDDMDALSLPLGSHGAVAIYTGQGESFNWLRRIGIRIYTWANWVIPLDFL